MTEAIRAWCDRPVFIDGQQISTEDGERIDAANTKRIAVAPPVLVFTLKRFAFVQETIARRKLHHKFAFPETIDIAEMLEKGVTMKCALNGVVAHTGSANSGHSTSIVKMREG
jgi:ubiquitin C-terminal hydrolase